MLGSAGRAMSTARAERSGARFADDPFGLVGSPIDGKYWIERVVGAGGFGVVYRARHLQFESPVAIKVLRVRESDEASRRTLSERVRQEGRLLFTLGPLHPSFVRVYEAGTLHSAGGPAPYLALEWLDGITLQAENSARHSLGRRLSIEQVLDLLDDVAQALTVAHLHGVAHRDIKPGNIFLTTREGRVCPRLLDFGVAKAVSLDPSASAFSDSQFGSCAFTPAYGAPEQWLRRLGATGTWTDVHALALVCVELMAGRQPLNASGAAEWITRCVEEVRATPRDLGIVMSDAVEEVFRHALALDPRERIRDVGSFWQALQDAAGSTHRKVFAASALTQAVEGPARIECEETQRTLTVTLATSDPQPAGAESLETPERSSPRSRSAASVRPSRGGVLQIFALMTGIAAVLTLGLLLSSSEPLRTAVATHTLPVVNRTEGRVPLQRGAPVDKNVSLAPQPGEAALRALTPPSTHGHVLSQRQGSVQRRAGRSAVQPVPSAEALPGAGIVPMDLAGHSGARAYESAPADILLDAALTRRK